MTRQVDARDQVRPLNYRGRFLEGICSKLKDKDFLWRNAALWRDGRTELATQLRTKEMLVVESTLEDRSGTAIGVPEGEEFLFGGARKVEQIGQNACEKILSGMMQDLQLTARSAIYIIDLNMSVGNMFEAYASLKSSWNYPVFYIGCTDDAQTAEWFQLHKEASIISVKNGLWQTKCHMGMDQLWSMYIHIYNYIILLLGFS